MQTNPHYFNCLSASLIAVLSLACGDSKSNSNPAPKAPAVIVGAKESRPVANPLLKPAPIPPKPVQPGMDPLPVFGSEEKLFLENVQGRWRTGCVYLDNGISRFYGIEFRDETWSTLIFDYSDNAACIHMAAPNAGQPRTYSRLSLLAEEAGATVDASESNEDSEQSKSTGWFRLKGSCISPDNACQGLQEVRLRFDEEGILRLQPISGNSLWIDPTASEMVYDF